MSGGLTSNGVSINCFPHGDLYDYQVSDLLAHHESHTVGSCGLDRGSFADTVYVDPASTRFIGGLATDQELLA